MPQTVWMWANVYFTVIVIPYVVKWFGKSRCFCEGDDLVMEAAFWRIVERKACVFYSDSMAVVNFRTAKSQLSMHLLHCLSFCGFFMALKFHVNTNLGRTHLMMLCLVTFSLFYSPRPYHIHPNTFS